MHDKEVLELMKSSLYEIKDRSAAIDRMRPRAEAYDLLRIVINLFNSREMTSTSVWPDITSLLSDRIAKLEK